MEALAACAATPGTDEVALLLVSCVALACAAVASEADALADVVDVLVASDALDVAESEALAGFDVLAACDAVGFADATDAGEVADATDAAVAVVATDATDASRALATFAVDDAVSGERAAATADAHVDGARSVARSSRG